MLIQRRPSDFNKIPPNKKPKILINCEAFYNYFHHMYVNTLTAGRFNWMVQEWEEFLSQLKAAGAQLFFFYKQGSSDHDSKWFRSQAIVYDANRTFLEKVAAFETSQVSRELMTFRLWKIRFDTTYDNSMAYVLKIAALKYGEFIGSGKAVGTKTAVISRIARDIGAYAVVGLDTGYLYVEGDFKLWPPQPQEYPTKGCIINFDIKELNKKAILDLMQMNLAQFQVFAILGGKLKGDLDDSDRFWSFFPEKGRIVAIKDFVHQHVPSKVTDEVIMNVIRTILGSVNPQTFENFKLSIRNFSSEGSTNDESSFKGDPFTYAELIFNNQTIHVFSSFLDDTTNDKGSLKNLAVDWIKRTMGLLLKHVDGEKTRKLLYRAEDWETIEVEPTIPDCRKLSI
jgi:hypothetical protein